MFDQLAPALGIDPGARDLLSAGRAPARRRYVVGYRQHHKHAYRLIAHRAAGWVSRRAEREIVALVARYHRRGEPKRVTSRCRRSPATTAAWSPPSPPS